MSDVRIKYLQTPNLPKTPIGDQSGSGMTKEVKRALLACFDNVAWKGTDGQDYYNALETALYLSVNVVSIAAVFTQGSAVVYDTDSLDTLRQYLTVTATYDDQTTRTVSAYTLSGTLTAGTSTITAEYNGKTATFMVAVTGVPKDLIYDEPLVMSAYNSNDAGTVSWDEDSQTGSIISTTKAGYPALISNGLLYQYSEVINKTMRFSASVILSGVSNKTRGVGVIVSFDLYSNANPNALASGIRKSNYDAATIAQDGTHNLIIEKPISEIFSNGTAGNYLGFSIILNSNTGSVTVSDISVEVY